MQIQLLGPVKLSSDNGGVALGGPKPRALLAMLALDAGSTVSADRLIDGLWGDEPPPTAAKMVQLYVSQLRKAMAANGEDGAIATHGRGYELQIGRDRVDAARFERLLAQGAAREALRLWRGPALADVADEPFAAAEIRRLEELRASALEVAIDQDLDAGRHRDVLPELEALLAQEPLRERLHAQRMLALYRSGRQAEALEAYREARATLVDQIGVEPGPELRRLHEAILRQDPSLDPPGQEPAGAPLVGRDAELAHLRALWRRARAGSGTSVLVTGPPGIGKTRLVQELADEVRRDGGAVAYGELDEVHAPTLLVLDDVAHAPEVPPGRPLLAVATAVDGEGEGETLPLAPLGRDEVAALARYHVGARAVVEPPVDRLAAESEGVPARVHRAAAAWARTVATRRIGEAAARASSERAGWHLAGDDVATEVVELQTVRERAQLVGSDALLACPFKGLASFDVEDAPVFFGRERLVADMIARLPGTRLMGIVGPSGSGKSSALRAGLLAALADGVLPGSERWPQALIRPGAHPLAALERATAELPDGERWIVAVDQFEETFTACRDAAERAAFVDALVACARDPGRRTLVLVAVRADFYGHCARYSELSRLLGANQVLVGPMRRHELRRAIELPARRAGLRVEPELVDVLLDDVEDEPGALPLLSTALLELWQQRDGRRLTMGAYERTGGVLGAVARLAERAYERLDVPQREAARRLLLRLAGDGGVRVRVPIGDLPGDVHDVLSVLASDRLITVGEGEVEVAHEALLREWPRLRAWLDEDADGRRVHRHLTEAARGWDAGGRDAGELYRGSRLVAASDWASAHDGDLNPLEREFVAAARAASEAEAERRRRANRRLRALLAGVGTLLVLAVVAGVVAVSQRGQARDAALVADAQRLGAEALTNERIDQALLLARAGIELDDTTATRSNLLALLVRDPASLGELRGDGWPVWSVALSDDDRLVAVGDERGVVIVYDTATRTRLGTYEAPEGGVQNPAFSPDGRALAVPVQCGTPLCDGETFVDLIDPRTGERRRRFVLPPLPHRPGWQWARVRFQPNGRDLMLLQADVAFPDGPASRIWRLDAARGTVEGAPLELGSHAARDLVTTGNRTQAFVTSPGDNLTWEIDPETLRVLRTYPVGGAAGAVSADGRLFALGSNNGTVRLLELVTGDVRRFHGRLESGGNMLLTFTADGRTLVASDDSGEIVMWDVYRGAIRERFSGPAGDIYGLAVSSDGRTLYSTAPDARMRIWDLAGDRRLDTRFDTGPPLIIDNQSPKGVDLSPDGRTLAVTQVNGTVDLVDARMLVLRHRLRAQRRAALGVEYSPDGRLLAVTGEGARLTLWDARTLAPVRELKGMKGFSQEVAFSPDGRLLAAGNQDGMRVRTLVWNVRTGERTGLELGVNGASIAFSPDGRLLAANGFEDAAEVLDVRTGRVVARLEKGNYSRSVAFSPDGELLAIGGYGGAARLVSTRTWKRVGRVMDGQEGRLTSLEFSPDGRVLATVSADGTVLLWDVATQRAIGSPLEIEPDAYVAAAFSRDGSHLFVVPHTGRGVRWDVRPESWKRHACLVAGRELTEAEWRDALPDRPLRPVCRRR